jgi:hypothetical protein
MTCDCKKLAQSWQELNYGQPTLVPNEFIDIVVPAENDLEHIQAKVIGGPLRAKLGRSEWHVTESCFGEWKEFHVLRLLGLVRTS